MGAMQNNNHGETDRRESAAIGRRQFLAGGIAATATIMATGVADAAGRVRKVPKKKPNPAPPEANKPVPEANKPAPEANKPASEAKPPDNLISSAPVLQNAAARSMGVAFSVTADASGWVEYSVSRKMTDAKRVYSGGAGLMTVDDKIAHIRIRGLSPATRYYYRIGADRIEYRGGYKMKNLGPEMDAKVHSFTTLGAQASGSFCVINDTHENAQTLDAAFRKLAELKPAVVIWNGDASNTSENFEAAWKVFIRPHVDHPEYASDTPFMFVRGNHDFRGRFNRTLERVVMARDPEERLPEYSELGRNFVQRLGDIALIGLDTGEDKLDTNPRFAGIFRMKEYRELQTKWLAHAIASPAVTTARYKVAFCHIPLFDSSRDANPGDLMPADVAEGFKKDYAAWQRTCAGLWGPHLAKAGVKLLITGHQHKYRRDSPGNGHPWIQLVGGGPNVDPEHAENFATIIEGRLESGMLAVRVHDLANSRVVDSFTV